MDRKSETLRIKHAATYYLTDKNFSVYDEVGLKSDSRYSRLRADLLGITVSGEIVIVEVKSCWQDFTSDNKWEKYLAFCNKMYFAISADLYNSKHSEHIIKRLKEFGIGLLVVSDLGSVSVKSNCKRRKVLGKTRRWLITKLAWRGGFCKATADRSMRFNTSFNPTTINLLEFLTTSKADRQKYLAAYPNCGYKKYINYPILDPKFIVGTVDEH